MSKITKSARGEECQVRIPGYCNFDNDTTILAHVNGGGMGMKNLDIEASYCCSTCHDVLDGRIKTAWTDQEIKLWFFESAMRTRKILIDKKLILIK